MSKRDDKRDSAHKSQDPDAESSFHSEAVKAFVGAVHGAIELSRGDGTHISKVGVIDFLKPQLKELDREVTESLARRDDKISDLGRQATALSNDLDQLKGQRDRERERLPAVAKKQFAEAMLNVVDAVDAAAKAMRGADEKVLEGILSISRMVDGNLQAQGFLKIDALHKQSHSQYHEAIGETESTNHDEGIVVEVVQGGYLQESTGDVLRPARVIVAKNPMMDFEGNRESTAEDESEPG